MMLAEEILSENWPAISRAIRYLDPDAMKMARNAYFKGKVGFGPPFVGRDVLGIEAKLILSHEIDDKVIEHLSVCKDWKYGNANQKRAALRVSERIFSNSCSHLFTFSSNTLYSGREEELLDALGFNSANRLQEITEQLATNYSPGRLSEYVRIPGAVSSYLRQSKPADHNVAWKAIPIWEARLTAIPAKTDLAEYHDDNWLLVEWACRNAERLDARVVDVAKSVREVLTSNRIQAGVSERYHSLIDALYDDYVCRNHLGEKITVAVQYDNQNQVKTSVGLLDPEQRYPMKRIDSPGVIKCLLDAKKNEYRMSRYILNSLWAEGQVFDSFSEPGNSMLIFYPATHTCYNTRGYQGLGYDTSDIESKYVAKTMRSNDAHFGETELLPHCIVIGDNYETCQVGTLHGSQFSSPKRLRFKENSKLKKVVGSWSTSEELAIKLCSKVGYKTLNEQLKICSSSGN